MVLATGQQAVGIEALFSASIGTIVVGIGAGVAFGLWGYYTKRDPDEPFKLAKLLRTVVVFGVAGALVAASEQTELTQSSIQAQTAYTVVLGKLVDEAYSKVRHLVSSTREVTETVGLGGQDGDSSSTETRSRDTGTKRAETTDYYR
jgi:hypothetical protein